VIRPPGDTDTPWNCDQPSWRYRQLLGTVISPPGGVHTYLGMLTALLGDLEVQTLLSWCADICSGIVYCALMYKYTCAKYPTTIISKQNHDFNVHMFTFTSM